MLFHILDALKNIRKEIASAISQPPRYKYGTKFTKIIMYILVIRLFNLEFEEVFNFILKEVDK